MRTNLGRVSENPPLSLICEGRETRPVYALADNSLVVETDQAQPIVRTANFYLVLNRQTVAEASARCLSRRPSSGRRSCDSSGQSSSTPNEKTFGWMPVGNGLNSGWAARE